MDKIDPTPGVRLLGVGVSSFARSDEGEQLSFDDLAAAAPEWRDAEGAIDEIRSRFGQGAIGHASSMRGGRVTPKTRGDQQWGPDQTDAVPD